nr:MAG TPA: hypothetical protein [Bacteriophage sp.]
MTTEEVILSILMETQTQVYVVGYFTRIIIGNYYIYNTGIIPNWVQGLGMIFN